MADPQEPVEQEPVEYSLAWRYPWYRMWLETEAALPRDPRKLIQITGV